MEDLLAQLRNYVNQQPNKHIINAFHHHKQLEEELFDFADNLSYSSLGIKTYFTRHSILEVEQNVNYQAG